MKGENEKDVIEMLESDEEEECKIILPLRK